MATTSKKKEPSTTRRHRSSSQARLEIVWEDPPEKEGRRGRTPYSESVLELLEAVQQRPDQWASVASFPGKDAAHKVARQLAAALASTRYSSKWEFDPRRVEGGSALYVKFHSDARRRRSVA